MLNQYDIFFGLYNMENLSLTANIYSNLLKSNVRCSIKARSKAQFYIAIILAQGSLDIALLSIFPWFMVFHWYFQMHFFFLLEIFLYLLSNKDMILPSFRKYRGSWTRNVSWGDGGFGNSPLSNWCQFSCKHNKFYLYQDINIYQHINHYGWLELHIIYVYIETYVSKWSL